MTGLILFSPRYLRQRLMLAGVRGKSRKMRKSPSKADTIICPIAETQALLKLIRRENCGGQEM